MQHHNAAPLPRPDIHARPLTQRNKSPPSQPVPPKPEFIIIGLFALRLAKKLISSLDYYPERDSDALWLTDLLSPYHPSYDLAKITGSQSRAYTRNYPEIVARMKRQPKYPLRFMELNPATADRCGRPHAQGETLDAHRLEVIDFVDAAGEWGLVVPLPASEAERMVALADRRRVGDLEEGEGQVDVGGERLFDAVYLYPGTA